MKVTHSSWGLISGNEGHTQQLGFDIRQWGSHTAVCVWSNVMRVIPHISECQTQQLGFDIRQWRSHTAVGIWYKAMRVTPHISECQTQQLGFDIRQWGSNTAVGFDIGQWGSHTAVRVWYQAMRKHYTPMGITRSSGGWFRGVRVTHTDRHSNSGLSSCNAGDTTHCTLCNRGLMVGNEGHTQQYGFKIRQWGSYTAMRVTQSIGD